MVASAEAPQTFILEAQEYGRSMRTIYALGVMAVESAASEEKKARISAGFDDHADALTEMLKTDKQFGRKLKIENNRPFPRINGEICTKAGESQRVMVQRGAEYSFNKSLEDPTWNAQAERDAGDDLFFEKVNDLQDGESIMRISTPPVEEIRKYPKLYRDRFGYKEQLTYIYYAHRQGDTVILGSYSVDGSDLDTWLELLAEQAVDIPNEVSHNTLNLLYIKEALSPEATIAKVCSLRDGYYQKQGIDGPQHSITEYVAQQKQFVSERFAIYYQALAKAGRSEQNHQLLQNFAATLIRTPMPNLRTELREQLSLFATTTGFNDEAGRTWDTILRYAMTETLREGLQTFLKSSGSDFDGKPPLLARTPVYQPVNYSLDPLMVDQINRQMAGNMAKGVANRRSYGGCPGQIQLSLEESLRENGGVDAYGNIIEPAAYRGRGGGSGRRSRELLSKSGKINCIKCRKSVDEREAKKTEGRLKCTHCKYEIDICTGAVKHSSKPDRNKVRSRGEHSAAETKPTPKSIRPRGARPERRLRPLPRLRGETHTRQKLGSRRLGTTATALAYN